MQSNNNESSLKAERPPRHESCLNVLNLHHLPFVRACVGSGVPQDERGAIIQTESRPLLS